jgi:hypothetical protein
VLPRDLTDVEQASRDTNAALILLDPLMSRLDERLDTYRDGDVRRALEPLAAVADRTGMAVLGIIHHNKSGSTDPLQLVMASRAFTAVARAVHAVVPDPDDDTGKRRLFAHRRTTSAATTFRPSGSPSHRLTSRQSTTARHRSAASCSETKRPPRSTKRYGELRRGRTAAPQPGTPPNG